MKIVLFVLALFSHFADAAGVDRCGTVPHSVAKYNAQKKFEGCRLISVEKDSPYERLGLKNGDVIQPTEKADQKMELQNSLKASGAQISSDRLTEDNSDDSPPAAPTTKPKPSPPPAK